MKRWWGFLCVIIVVASVSVYVGSDSLASFVWQKYHWSKVAVLLDRNDTGLAMFIGDYHFNNVMGGGEYNLDVAENAYQKAISINSKVLWGHYQLARIRFVKGDYDSALEEIEEELKTNPENLRSLYIRGLIYGYRSQVTDLEKAEADFRRFTEWAPTEWAGYNDLAWIFFKEGKYAEAETELERAFINVPEAERNPWLWNAMGVAELNLAKYSRATGSFGKAKTLAGNLTSREWQRSYPGNDPTTSGEGLSTFQEAINENLRRAESKI